MALNREASNWNTRVSVKEINHVGMFSEDLPLVCMKKTSNASARPLI